MTYRASYLPRSVALQFPIASLRPSCTCKLSNTR